MRGRQRIPGRQLHLILFAIAVLLLAVFLPHASALTPTSTVAATAAPTPGPCTGDCDRNGEVTVDELLMMVNVALGTDSIFSSCLAGDADGDQAIQITEIIAAINRALEGCGGPEPGYCYESSACFPSDVYPSQPFSANRGYCCSLQRTEHGVPFSWCPASLFDASTAACGQCANPC